MEHKCKKCGSIKDVSLFRRMFKKGPYEPWNLRECKKCVHDIYLERYANKNTRNKFNKCSRNWKKKNPQQHAKINNKWYHANKEKARAGSRLRYAVKTGRVKKMPCEVCETCDKVQGHHDSYTKGDELKVRWLCQEHHKLWHQILDRVEDKVNLDNRFAAFVRCTKV